MVFMEQIDVLIFLDSKILLKKILPQRQIMNTPSLKIVN